MDEKIFNYLRDSLAHNRDVKNALDNKASLLLAISGAIFTLSIANINRPTFTTLAIFMAAVIMLCVWSVFLPQRDKTKVKKGFFCWWGYDMKNFDEYKNNLNEIFAQPDKILDEYETEIWNIVNFSIKLKTKTLKAASLLFVAGVLISLLFIGA